MGFEIGHRIGIIESSLRTVSGDITVEPAYSIIFDDGSTKIRKTVRGGALVIDKALEVVTTDVEGVTVDAYVTADGFDGIEGINWINIKTSRP